jgi:hypothetical protein
MEIKIPALSQKTRQERDTLVWIYVEKNKKTWVDRPHRLMQDELLHSSQNEA